MLKRKYIFLFAIILITLIGVVIILIIKNRAPDVKSFDVSQYQYYIDTYPSDKSVGSILDAKDVIVKAENFWIEKYGNGVKKKKPYQVFYDEKNGVWLVKGSLPPNMDGGVPHILIENSTGDVLAVWHDK